MNGQPSPYFLRNGKIVQKTVPKAVLKKKTLASKLSVLDVSDTEEQTRAPSESTFHESQPTRTRSESTFHVSPPNRRRSKSSSPIVGQLDQSIIIPSTMNSTFTVYREDEGLSSSDDENFDPLPTMDDESSSDDDAYYDPSDLGQVSNGQQDITNTHTQSGFKFLTTQQSRPKLALNGYHYTIDFHNTKTDTYYWKCEYATKTQTRAKCYGRAIGVGAAVPVVSSKNPHNHKPVPERTTALEKIDDMMKEARISTNDPRAIQNKCQKGVGDLVAVYLPRPTDLANRMKRQRAKQVSSLIYMSSIFSSAFVNLPYNLSWALYPMRPLTRLSSHSSSPSTKGLNL